MTKELTPFEALESIKDLLELEMDKINYQEDLDTIEKSLKALEIIKHKTIDIWLIQNKRNVKEYNSMLDSSRWLIQEEFDLLKEVLS